MGFLMGLGGRVAGMLGGSVLGYLKIAGAVAAVVTIGLLYWRLGSSEAALQEANITNGQYQRANQDLRDDISQRDVALADWEKRYQEEARERERLDQLLVEREEDNKHLARDLKALQDNIGVLRRENKDVEAYLSQPIPGPLLERLQQEFSSATTTRPATSSSAEN